MDVIAVNCVNKVLIKSQVTVLANLFRSWAVEKLIPLLLFIPESRAYVTVKDHSNNKSE